MDCPVSKIRFLATPLLIAALAGGDCALAVTSTPPAPPAGAELYFKPPEFTAPAISQDGKNVGFIAQNNGHSRLFRLDLETGQIKGIFSAGEGDVSHFWWLGSQRVLVAAWGKDGREYFVQDLTDSPPRPIPSLEGWKPGAIRILPNDRDHVIAFYYWGEQYLARIDLTTGRSSKIESFVSDNDYTVISSSGELRAKIWASAGKWHIAWRSRVGVPWHTTESSLRDLPIFTPVGIAPDDRHLLVYAHDQGDTAALMLLDPETDRRTLLAQRANCDPVGLVELAPATGAVGVEFFTQGPDDITFFDDTARQFAAVLNQSLPGMSRRVTSSSQDGTRRIVEAWVPGYPTSYYLFDQRQHRLSLIGEQRPDISAGSLGNVHYFNFQTRDGLQESGYVLLPRSPESAKPGPLIILVMQAVGEAGASANFYNAQNQFFASRGFAVAHIAVRGTRGFGRKYLQAGDLQVTGKIVQDLEDAVAHLAREGRIDPRRVALVGVGYGGMFALRAAAFSQAFQAVVVRNAQWGETATSVGWMTSSTTDIATTVQQVGGTQAAYNLVRQFQPESFIEKLSAPTLLIDSGLDLQRSFEKHHKSCEIYEPKGPQQTTLNGAQIRMLAGIADFLDRTLK